MVFPSSSIVLILKSTPIVEMYDSVYVSSANLKELECNRFVHIFGQKFDVPEKEARFSHTGVTNKEELEKVITEKKSVLEPGSFNAPLNNPPTLCHCVS